MENGIKNPYHVKQAVAEDGAEVNPYLQKRSQGKRIYINQNLYNKGQPPLYPRDKLNSSNSGDV